MPAHPASSLPVYLLIGLITAAIFAVDLVTRLGVAEWVLYLLPVALSMLQPRLVVPLVVAAIATVLVVVGLFFSPPSGSLMQVIVNRSMGLVAIWSTAILVHRVLRGRAHEQLQLWLQQGETTVTQSLAGEQSLAELGQSACTALARYTGAAVAVLHRLEDDTLHALGSYSLALPVTALAPTRLGEGLELPDPQVAARLHGYAALHLHDVPDAAQRQLQALRMLGQATGREATVLAYNDLFLLVGWLSLATLGWLLADLYLRRRNPPAAPPAPVPPPASPSRA